MASFDDAVARVLEREGGYVDHPADRGGPTNFGICQRDFPAEDIARLTVGRACELYRQHYWHPLFDRIVHQPVANKLFDLCVWFGAPKGIRLAQVALHHQDATVDIDGVMGPQTLQALNLSPVLPLLRELRFRAAQHVTALALADKTQVAFLDGWLRRACW